MSNYQSYSSYVPAGTEEVFSAGPNIRHDSVVHRTTSSGGVMQESSEASTDRGSEGQLNPNYGDGSWKATATTKTGRPVSQIAGDCLVTIGGVQGSVDFFCEQGYLQKAPDGTYSEGTGNAPPPEVSQGDTHSLSDESMAVVNQMLEPLPQSQLDSVIAQVAGVVAGTLSDDSLTKKFSTQSGISLDDAAQRLTVLKSLYQSQTDNAISSKYGIDANDKDDFYQWCRTTAKGEMQDAVMKQLHSNQVSAWKPLADRYLAANAPSINAFKQAGIPVRGNQVFLGGHWLTPQAAARAGLA